MTVHYLTIQARDPIIARDGRPFGADQGRRMRSNDWPYPSVLAGSLRTLLGKTTSEFSPEVVQALKEISIAGPLPELNGELYFPAPRDQVVFRADDGQRRRMVLRPFKPSPNQVCDLPKGLLPVDVTEDVKPARAPAFWAQCQMAIWLSDATGTQLPPPPEIGTRINGYLDNPEKDVRIHAKIDANQGAAEEGKLFMTVGLDLHVPDTMAEISLAVKVEANDDCSFAKSVAKLDALHPLGGERRLAHWRCNGKATKMWGCPPVLKTALTNTTGVRLVLATPALFKNGWCPGWLDENTFEGEVPNTGVHVRLISACVEHWKAISGWSLEKDSDRNIIPGPKAVRRLVPAGCVYFFQIIHGSAADLTSAWLKSVSDSDDDSQDQRDGFGLALWGVWDDSNHKREKMQ